jgi:hypothetical protein
LSCTRVAGGGNDRASCGGGSRSLAVGFCLRVWLCPWTDLMLLSSLGCPKSIDLDRLELAPASCWGAAVAVFACTATRSCKLVTGDSDDMTLCVAMLIVSSWLLLLGPASIKFVRAHLVAAISTCSTTLAACGLPYDPWSLELEIPSLSLSALARLPIWAPKLLIILGLPLKNKVLNSQHKKPPPK